MYFKYNLQDITGRPSDDQEGHSITNPTRSLYCLLCASYWTSCLLPCWKDNSLNQPEFVWSPGQVRKPISWFKGGLGTFQLNTSSGDPFKPIKTRKTLLWAPGPVILGRFKTRPGFTSNRESSLTNQFQDRSRWLGLQHTHINTHKCQFLTN